MFKTLKKVLIRLFLFIVLSISLIILLSIVSIFTYPWFYKTFMPLKVISVDYSPDKKFKAEESFIPYLHHSLGTGFYRMRGGYLLYRVTNVKTGEVIGDMEDETFDVPFQFEGNNKFCIDLRFAYNRTEDEWCIDLR